jgi:hypothetical protein
MSRFDIYRDGFPNARLKRSETAVLEVALHTDGGMLIFNGYGLALEGMSAADVARGGAK